MDRESVRRLRAQPGYQAFVGAATLARVADEMFSVGVVLLVLDRTDSPGLAGATVAAITLPSLLTAPLLGAWLDVSGSRRALMALDQVVIAAVLIALVFMIGNAPNWTVLAITAIAGLDLPALVRRLHQPDPGAGTRGAADPAPTRSRRAASTWRS